MLAQKRNYFTDQIESLVRNTDWVEQIENDHRVHRNFHLVEVCVQESVFKRNR